jgi:hypothetical protein
LSGGRFPMTTVAEGKEAVLAYLEQETQKSAGKPGVYLLVRDDSGNLIAYIAGHSFMGTGSYSIDGNRMVVVDGAVVHLQQRQNA